MHASEAKRALSLAEQVLALDPENVKRTRLQNVGSLHRTEIIRKGQLAVAGIHGHWVTPVSCPVSADGNARIAVLLIRERPLDRETRKVCRVVVPEPRFVMGLDEGELVDGAGRDIGGESEQRIDSCGSDRLAGCRRGIGSPG